MAAADNGDADAALAEKIFVERIRKYIGSFLVKVPTYLYLPTCLCGARC